MKIRWTVRYSRKAHDYKWRTWRIKRRGSTLRSFTTWNSAFAYANYMCFVERKFAKEGEMFGL